MILLYLPNNTPETLVIIDVLRNIAILQIC